MITEMNAQIYSEHLQAMTRRHFFGRSARGLGTLALASLLNQDLFATGKKTKAEAGAKPFPAHGTINPLHFAPRAKRVIYLFQSGAPSQLDLYDNKPLLNKMQGEDLPASIRMGQRLTGMTASQKEFPLAGSFFKFNQYGESRAWVSELMPYTSKIVDK